MNAEIDFKKLVKRIRRVRGITQEQLARELSVTFGTVNGWENGKHQPIPALARSLLEVAQAAGIPLNRAVPGERRRRARRSRQERR